MRLPLFVTAALLSVAFAGCISSDDPGPSARTEPRLDHAPSPTELEGAAPFSTFLCRDGFRLADDTADGAIDRCNHRVTKPLLDSDWFNVRDQHGPANEVSIAVNPLDPLKAAGGGKDYTVSYVSQDARCGEYTVWMGTYWTTDGGITWGNDLMRGFAGDNRESPLHGQWCNTDPVLAYDDDGTLWFQALNYLGQRDHEDSFGTSNPVYPYSQHDLFTGSQLYFARSDDDGATYPFISFAAKGDAEQVFHDKQWFAVQHGGDHMIATWSMFTGTPPAPDEVPEVVDDATGYGESAIMFSESFDDGATWSEPAVMTSGPASSVNVQFSTPAYLDEDTIVVTWRDYTGQGVYEGYDAQEETYVAYTEGTIMDGATSFEPPQRAFEINGMKSLPGRDGTGPTHFRSSSYPVLALDTSGGDCDGRRYVVWPDQPGSVDTDVDVLLRWSDDGDTWSEPITVNDVDQGDQFMAWIDTDPDGGVHVSWYDRRNDETNHDMDLYYAYSDDCGESFYPNIRVTETLFNGDLGHHQSGAPFIGDYNGIDATSEAVYLIWADTRHSCDPDRRDPCNAPMRIGSDVYTATILKDGSAFGTFEAAFD